MLKIVLCDDDPFILKVSTDQIQSIIQEDHIAAEVVSLTTSSQELLSYVKKNPSLYLVFLDLDFGEGRMNGMDIAKTLRQTDSDCKLVITTNHNEMAMDVLKSGIEPYGFLEKSSDIRKLKAGYRRYIHMLLQDRGEFGTQDTSVITLSISTDENIPVVLSDIIYLETEKSISHGITYHIVNGSTITIISTLEAEKKRLGDHFIKTHRSYLVNSRHILGMKDGIITLSNRETVPCALRLRSEVKKWLM